MTDYSELVARLREVYSPSTAGSVAITEAADALEEQGREIELWKEREAQWLRENALVEDENNKLRSRLAEVLKEVDHHHDQDCSRMRGPYGEQWRDDKYPCTCWVGDIHAVYAFLTPPPAPEEKP